MYTGAKVEGMTLLRLLIECELWRYDCKLWQW